jgi:hypothetical protein
VDPVPSSPVPGGLKRKRSVPSSPGPVLPSVLGLWERPSTPEAHHEPHLGSPVAPEWSPITPKPLAPPVSLSRPAAQQQQQQQSLGGPQSDPRTKPAVTPVGIPTTTAGADLGVMTHAPSGQASMSGLVIPRESSSAGSQLTTQRKPFAGSDTLEEVNRLLVREGFPEFDKMSNDYVIRHYGACSDVGHSLGAFLAEWREQLRYRLRADRAIATGTDGCQTSITTRIAKRKWCGVPGCTREKAISICMHRHRYAAILAEPAENAWMGFVYMDKTAPRVRMFDASHMCSTETPNHCIRSGHVLLESHSLNTERTPHQTGTNNAGICHHTPPCLGERVKLPAVPKV